MRMAEACAACAGRRSNRSSTVNNRQQPQDNLLIEYDIRAMAPIGLLGKVLPGERRKQRPPAGAGAKSRGCC